MKYLAIMTLALFILSCENKGKKVVKEETAKEVATEEKVEKVMIKGKILSANDSTPLAMSFIVVPGTNIGTMSDGTGAFMINIPETSNELLFTADGYESEKIKVSSDAKNNIYLKSKSN